MKSFFSIVYLPLRPDLQEKISIGLVMSNSEKNIFKFSDAKLHIIKNLFSSNRYNLVKDYFNNLKNEIEPKNDEFKLSLDYNNTNWINESYFNYLNKYSNNLVVYSKPNKIELDVSLDNFKLLFEKFVFNFEEEIETLKKENILSKVKTRLYSKIESQVNLNVTVRSKDFNELVTPVDVNFLGKNGVVVSGQTLDFSKRLYNLEHDLTSYISFTKAVDFKEKNKGKYFIVGQEPHKKEHPKNHKTWKHVRESHLVEYVDLSETEKIKEYIYENQVTPFFEKENIK